MAPVVAWDACGILNLVATNRAEEILQTIHFSSVVVRQVKEREVLFLRPFDADAEPQEKHPVSIEPLIARGLLSITDLTEPEEEAFVSWAESLDDGEAYSLAVAQARGFYVATDDQATLNQMARQQPPILALTTPDWAKQWAELTDADADTVRETLQRIEKCAKYVPRKSHPLRSWWLERNV